MSLLRNIFVLFKSAMPSVVFCKNYKEIGWKGVNKQCVFYHQKQFLSVWEDIHVYLYLGADAHT